MFFPVFISISMLFSLSRFDLVMKDTFFCFRCIVGAMQLLLVISQSGKMLQSKPNRITASIVELVKQTKSIKTTGVMILCALDSWSLPGHCFI